MVRQGVLRRRRDLHYAWVVFGLTFFVLVAAAGVRSTPGVLIVPLGDEFGWSRATVSLAVSINLVLFGLGGPFAAALMERYGVRRIVVAALMTIATGVALTTVMRTPWQLDLLWGVVVGCGTASMATVLAATVANRWFVRHRGLVVGVLSAASATGQLIFLPLLSALVTWYGWRWASGAVAIALLVAIPPVLLLMRDRPSDLGLRAYGAAEDEPAAATPANPIGVAVRGLRLASRSGVFWLLGGSFFICGATTNGLIGTHLIPAAMDHGMTEVTAAGLLALVGLFDIVGTMLSGWLTDRHDSRWLLFWYYGLRGLALLLLPFVLGQSFLGLVVFIVFYGLDWVATVPPTVALARECFGPAWAGVVFGWIFACHQLGAAAAAGAAGAARSWLGDYQVSFISAGLLCLLASGLVIRISPGRPAAGLFQAEPAAA